MSSNATAQNGDGWFNGGRQNVWRAREALSAKEYYASRALFQLSSVQSIESNSEFDRATLDIATAPRYFGSLIREMASTAGLVSVDPEEDFAVLDLYHQAYMSPMDALLAAIQRACELLARTMVTLAHRLDGALGFWLAALEALIEIFETRLLAGRLSSKMRSEVLLTVCSLICTGRDVWTSSWEEGTLTPNETRRYVATLWMHCENARVLGVRNLGLDAREQRRKAAAVIRGLLREPG